jgi:hypothetical protein
LLVSRRTGEYAPLLPEDSRWDAIFGRILQSIGGLSLVTDDAGTAPFKLLGVLAQNPRLAFRVASHLTQHVIAGKMPASLLRDTLRGDVHTIGIGIHNFMDAAMVARADQDPVIKARLDSCVFKGAVKQNGEWVGVPMCKMNETKWAEIYARRFADPVLRAMPQAHDRAAAAPEPVEETVGV